MKTTPKHIIWLVANKYRVPVNKVLSTSRKRVYVEPRQVSIYFIRKYFSGLSLAQIGKYFCGRTDFKDHATVLSSCNVVRNMIETDIVFKINVDHIDKVLSRFHESIAIESKPDNHTEIALIAENEHLRNEIVRHKKEISKLQDIISQGKFVAKKQIRLLKRESPFAEVESRNNRPFMGYNKHQL